MCRVRSVQSIDLFLSYAVCMLAASHYLIGILIFYTGIYKNLVQICFAKNPHFTSSKQSCRWTFLEVVHVFVSHCYNALS
jgi:hypothetical protein